MAEADHETSSEDTRPEDEEGTEGRGAVSGPALSGTESVLEAAAAEVPLEEALSNASWSEALEAASGVQLSQESLTQSEIDKLWSEHIQAREERTARNVMELIADSTIVNYERLPMLDVVLDQMVRLLTENLRQFLSANIEISIEDSASVRFGDFMASVPLPTVISILDAEEWESSCLAVLDCRLAYVMVEVLLGGRNNVTPNVEMRPLSSIERRLTQRLIKVLADQMTAAFRPLTDVTFTFNRLETNPKLVQICRSTNVAVQSRLLIDIEGYQGQLDLVIPYATLEPVRNLLVQMFMGEKFGRDNVWEDHMERKLRQTDIRLDAIMFESQVSLGEALGWTPGTFIPLEVTPNSPVSLRIDDTTLMSGRMGQKSGSIAVKIESTNFDQPREAR